MNIKELIAEEQTKEAIVPALAAGARGLAKVGTKGLAAGARGLAKGTGAALGGLAGMGSAFKQGYTGGKLAVAGGPTTGATTNTGNIGSDAGSIRQQIAQKKAEIIQLQQQLGAPKVEPGIGQQQGQVAAVASNTPEPGAVAPTSNKPAANTPPVEPGIGNQQNPVSAIASNTPDPAAVRQQKQAAAAKVAQDQMAANAAAAPAAGTAPAANPAKPSPQQIRQAQLKKDLLKRQQARTAGGKQPSGFAASGVGAPRQRIYTGAGGAPKSYTVRESVGFYSKFLGQDI